MEDVFNIEFHSMFLQGDMFHVVMEARMRKILLIGGAGFIGQRVARVLTDRDTGCRVFDRAGAIERLPPELAAEAIAGDVTDPASVLAAAQGCAGIVHLAGLMTVDCAADPTRALGINVAGSLNVFEAARQTGATVAYLSTAGVFGPEDAQHPRPMTIYGVTKLAVEGLARVYAADHGVPSLGLRPYIVYGPGVSSGIAAGPSIALAAAVRREPSTIRFSGRVGFVFVDDVARLLAAAVTRPIAGAQVLTMAGDTRDMSEFTTELARQSGWSGTTVDGAPLRIPAELTSDLVPAELGDHKPTPIEVGIADTLEELRAAASA